MARNGCDRIGHSTGGDVVSGAWEPIATAPMESVGALRPHILISDGRYVMVAWWNIAAEAWYNSACHKIAGEPTHWQPLPAPPTHLTTPEVV